MAIDDEPVESSPEDDLLELADGLARLSGLVAGSGTLVERLSEVADFAVLAVPGADGAGVTMLTIGQPETIVASETFVRDVDSVQYRVGEGPCISAAATGRTMISPALGEDAMWPVFGPLAADLGVHSALSLPLLVNGEVVGALNVYSRRRNAFNAWSRRVGEQFARPAAVAIRNARTLDQAQRAAVEFEVALTNRSTVDRAVGVVMAGTGLSADDAFVRLRIMSQRERVEMTVIAERLLEEAVRRGQTSRRSDEQASRRSDEQTSRRSDEQATRPENEA